MISRILVVDDEVNNIDVLCSILMPSYEVIVAKSGKSAIEKARKHQPDLILLDVILPDLLGFDVITNLKSNEATASIPVIFITSLDDIKSEEKGLLLGAVDYITKPFQNSIVKARVRTYLEIGAYINNIEKMCKIDALTNIANRRHLNSQMSIEWRRAARDEKYLGLLMIDIDNFKKYNDTYGHPQGDTLLRNAALVFTDTLLRPADLVARWGGEEFAVLLPDADLLAAQVVAERVRGNIENMAVPTCHGEITKVTISVGINSEIPSNNGSLEEFVNKADKALYIAKNSGRNRYCSFSDEIFT